MNTITSNSLYTHRAMLQTEAQNHIRNRKSNLGSTKEQMGVDVPMQKTPDAGISTLDAYERLGGTVRVIPDAGQDENSADAASVSVEMREAEQLPAAEDESETEKVTDIGVASLPNGISFYFNDDTGEVSCISDNDSRPGRQVLWSKTLSPENMARCDKLFDNYKDEAAGHFVFRYKAYLKHEEFWDMYLDDKVDLTALVQKDDTLSDDEIYDKFIQDMANQGK